MLVFGVVCCGGEYFLPNVIEVMQYFRIRVDFFYQGYFICSSNLIVFIPLKMVRIKYLNTSNLFD